MTSTLERPAAPAGRRRAPRRSGSDLLATLPVAAVTAAAWAAGVGLLLVGALVTLAWAVTGRGSDGLATPLEAAGLLWLAGHHAPVDTVAATGTGDGPVVTLLPLALLALVLVLLVLAGRWAVRMSPVRTWGDVVLLVALGSACYAALGLAVCQVATLGGATVAETSAIAAPGLLAVVGLGAGAVSGSDLGRSAWAQLPALVRGAGLAAAAALCSLVVLAGLAALATLAVHWTQVLALTRQLATSPGDALGLALATLAYLPNLLVWALAYLCGPGFGVGGPATVDPFAAAGALLPAFPPLAAVPAPAPAAGPLLLLLPVLAGAVAAVVLRHRVTDLGVREEALVVLLAAALVGAVVAVAAALSGGSLGDGRLVDLGPPALLTGAAAAALVGAGALLVSLGTRLSVGLPSMPSMPSLPVLWVRDETDDDPA